MRPEETDKQSPINMGEVTTIQHSIKNKKKLSCRREAARRSVSFVVIRHLMSLAACCDKWR